MATQRRASTSSCRWSNRPPRKAGPPARPLRQNGKEPQDAALFFFGMGKQYRAAGPEVAAMRHPCCCQGRVAECRRPCPKGQAGQPAPAKARLSARPDPENNRSERGRARIDTGSHPGMAQHRRSGHSAAWPVTGFGTPADFMRKPRSSWSKGATGYSPEKQASQYCGQALLRPLASPTAR